MKKKKIKSISPLGVCYKSRLEKGKLCGQILERRTNEEIYSFDLWIHFHYILVQIVVIISFLPFLVRWPVPSWWNFTIHFLYYAQSYYLYNQENKKSYKKVSLFWKYIDVYIPFFYSTFLSKTTLCRCTPNLNVSFLPLIISTK